MRLTRKHIGKMVRLPTWQESYRVSNVKGSTVWLLDPDDGVAYDYRKVTTWIVSSTKRNKIKK